MHMQEKALQPAAPTLGSVAEDLRDALAGQLRETSIAVYRRDVRQYDAWCLSEGRHPFDPRSLDAWVLYLVNRTRISPKTINRMVAAVKRTIKEAADPNHGVVEPGLAADFVLVHGVKEEALAGRLKPTARVKISPEEMRLICAAPDQDTLIGLRDAALLATLASSGCRVSEIATLTPVQVYVEEGTAFLSVMGKRQTLPRTALLSQEAYRLIQTWLSRRAAAGIASPYVFNGFSTNHQRPLADHLHPSSIWRLLQKYIREAGLAEVLRGVKPHDLRRFLGTQIIKTHGLAVGSRALGHKNIQVTQTAYNLNDLAGGLSDNLY